MTTEELAKLITDNIKNRIAQTNANNEPLPDLYKSDEALNMIHAYEMEHNEGYSFYYVFEIKLKYDHETKYDIIHEICEYDDGDIIWETDWNEGQTDVQFLRVVSIDTLIDNYFKNNDRTGISTNSRAETISIQAGYGNRSKRLNKSTFSAISGETTTEY